MDLMAFFKRDDELLNRYQRLRETGRNLNHRLVKQLPKAALSECGKKLGILKGKTLVFGDEHELSVLFDYCLYNYRRNGKSVIDRHLELSPPPAISDERLLVEAMSHSYYSLFLVEDIQTDKGATLRDLLCDETLCLIDIGIGQSARPGMILAGRVLPLADFHMTSGALIPVQGQEMRRQVMLIVQKFLKNKKAGEVLFSPSHEAAFSAQIIRTLLRAGALDTTVYRGTEE